MMKFGNLEAVIKRCEEHLDATNTRSTEIESYFVQYLLVRICAEFEARVTTLVRRRCARTRDVYLKSFAQKSAEQICRSFAVSDMARVLGRFGDVYRAAFHAQVMNGIVHVAWDNIYTNRVAVAHKSGTQMTMRDLKTAYTDSLLVFDALVAALNLTARETRDLN